jgi:hypothetical protein
MVRKRGSGEWKDQLVLAEHLHPEGVVWPYPLASSLFHLSGFSRLLYQELNHHWVWYEGHQLLGSITARQSSERAALRLILLVDPSRRGEIEAALISTVLKSYSYRKLEFILDYPAGVAEHAMDGLGFKNQRTLTWMSMQVQE